MLLIKIPADIRVRSYHSIRSIQGDFAKPVAMVRSCIVYWGPTGTGKTRRAWEEGGLEAYPKDPNTKWWNGYRGQDCVIIDEFRGSIAINHLLRWLDRYPVYLEIKGSSAPLMATKFWITSNLEPNDWYPDLDAASKEALFRRLDVKYIGESE